MGDRPHHTFIGLQYSKLPNKSNINLPQPLVPLMRVAGEPTAKRLGRKIKRLDRCEMGFAVLRTRECRNAFFFIFLQKRVDI